MRRVSRCRVHRVGRRRPLVKVWDARTGREVRSLEGHEDFVTACAISPDGGLIASAGGDGSVRVWRVDGEPLRTLDGHTARVWSCAFTPDGRFLVSGAWDSTVRVWPEPWRAEAPAAEAVAAACAFRPDGRVAISSGSDGTLSLWDAGDGTRFPMPSPAHEGSANACAAAPDAAAAVTGGEDRAVRMWDLQSGALLRAFDGHLAAVGTVAVSPDGGRVASGGDDWLVKVWDAAGGQEIWSAKAHEYGVRACGVSPDGRHVVTVGRDGALKIWDADRGTERRAIPGDGKSLECLAISPDGTFLVCGGDSPLAVRDAATGEMRRPLAGHTGRLEWIAGVTACAITPDARFAVSGGEDHTVRLWDVATGDALGLLPTAGEVRCVSAHPWRPTLAYGDATGGLHLVDLVGIEYGPIVVTPADRGAGPAIRCPSCFGEMTDRDAAAGRDIVCPTPGCGLQMRVNPFTAGARADRRGLGRLFGRG